MINGPEKVYTVIQSKVFSELELHELEKAAKEKTQHNDYSMEDKQRVEVDATEEENVSIEEQLMEQQL